MISLIFGGIPLWFGLFILLKCLLNLFLCLFLFLLGEFLLPLFLLLGGLHFNLLHLDLVVDQVVE